VAFFNYRALLIDFANKTSELFLWIFLPDLRPLLPDLILHHPDIDDGRLHDLARMQVELGGHQRGMPQQVLQILGGDPGLCQVCGVGVPQELQTFGVPELSKLK